MAVLAEHPQRIDRSLLSRFEEFRSFVRRENRSDTEDNDNVVDTPEDVLARAYQTLNNELAKEIIQQLKTNPPSLFENIVVDLLVKMGYGGSLRDAGEAIGKSGDEGIDGIIKEDRLGLDIIYIQATRWDGTVGRPEIQKFAGALQGQRAKKGVFITTSDFSRDAVDYASRIDNKIILIDGDTLAQYD
jgi:restriction system protein